MLRTLLVAIATIGLSLQARAADDALTEALFGYQHDTAAGSLAATAELAAPLAAEDDPLCGTIVEGELVLDHDVSCSGIAFHLHSDATLDLNGFTLEGLVFAGSYHPGTDASNVTIRNGTLLHGGIDCEDRLISGCLIEDVRVVDGTGFVVEAGPNTTIRHCDFSGNDVAVDLYYDTPDSYVVIEDSTFENNYIAINNAKHNYATVSRNVFQDNEVAVRLYAELGNEISFNTVDDNDFVGNGVGVVFDFHLCSIKGRNLGIPCHNGNVVSGNTFDGNHASGILFGGAECNSSYANCTEVDASIEGNFFSGNGFASSEPFPSVDDGITAIGPPDVVDGLTISGNFAVSNFDLGIEAPGATDGGGNLASGNGNPLQCVGVVCGSAWHAQALALLDDFDAAVASGDLRGTHRGTLGALRNLIQSSGDLLDRGWTPAACAQLEAARRRADGELPPPDFVRGPGVPALEAEIVDLRTSLGCDALPPPGSPPGCGRGFEMAAVVPPLVWLRRRTWLRR